MERQHTPIQRNEQLMKCVENLPLFTIMLHMLSKRHNEKQRLLFAVPLIFSLHNMTFSDVHIENESKCFQCVIPDDQVFIQLLISCWPT